MTYKMIKCFPFVMVSLLVGRLPAMGSHSSPHIIFYVMLPIHAFILSLYMACGIPLSLS